MIILLSPAKILDYSSKVHLSLTSKPDFIDRANYLASLLQQFSIDQLSKLMSVSSKLARLNFERYQLWDHEHTPSRQAVFAFKGDVYQGIEAENFSMDDLLFAQQHLRILSGLYGYLRPADMIKPHRLEMGTKLQTDAGKDLTTYWQEVVTKAIKKDLQTMEQPLVVNLASNEYSAAVTFKELHVEVFTPEFKDFKNGKYITISFYAKKARGRMSSFIIKNRISKAEDLVAFSADGYHYNNQLSDKYAPVFTRG
ncbi:MAG: peroxide stress protein YaaA [Bacteroidales bacterium]|nr:peroxide stress protein YaaA [Bacteroidales bacterium]